MPRHEPNARAVVWPNDDGTYTGGAAAVREIEARFKDALYVSGKRTGTSPAAVETAPAPEPAPRPEPAAPAVEATPAPEPAAQVEPDPPAVEATPGPEPAPTRRRARRRTRRPEWWVDAAAGGAAPEPAVEADPEPAPAVGATPGPEPAPTRRRPRRRARRPNPPADAAAAPGPEPAARVEPAVGGAAPEPSAALQPAAAAAVEAAPAPAAPAALEPLAAPPPPDRDPAAVYLASLSTESGRAGMRSNLQSLAALIAPGADLPAVPWPALRFQHVAAVRTALIDSGAAPATVNVKLSALRQVLRAAWQLGQMSTDDYMRATAVKNGRGSRLPAGRALDGDEIRALFAACADGTPAGARDAAALTLMFGCGLRRAEAAAVRLADYRPEDGALTVVGKGNRQRTVYAPEGAGRALAAWIAVRGGHDGPILAPVSKGGEVGRGAISPHAIMKRLARRAEQAGVERCSPHDLRRTFVSSALEAGADLAHVQTLAGHASPTTTSRYDRRPETARRAAAGKVHVPFVGPGDPGDPSPAKRPPEPRSGR